MLRDPILACALGLGLLGCAHSPETVMQLSAPPGGAWSVRDHRGARLCALPCRVELESNETVVVAREGGSQEFVVHQENLGPGAWSGGVRVQRDRSAGAEAAAAWAKALVQAGTTLTNDQRDDHVAMGIVLSGIGAIGMLASDSLPSRRREELWLERMSTSTK